MILAAVSSQSFFFFLFAGLACAFALGVLFSDNVVRMAFYLIVSLASTAGLFILAGCTFIGAMQIMIYVGGTLVLLIFGVMLTAQATFVSLKTQAGDWIMSAVVGIALLSLLLFAAMGVQEWQKPRADQATLGVAHMETASSLGAGMINVRVDKLHQEDESLRGGMSGYLLPFQAIGVHLLIVLIGAAYLARPKRRVSKTEVENA